VYKHRLFTDELERNLIKRYIKGMDLNTLTRDINTEWNTSFTVKQIQDKIYKLGLHKRRIFTRAESSYIRSRFNGSGTTPILARELDATSKQIWLEAKRLGLIFRRKGWTAQEKLLVEKWVPKFGVESTARKLCRPFYATKKIAWEVGVSPLDRDQWYTIDDMEKGLGVTFDWVHKRIDQGLLKATRESTFWRIKERDLKVFVRTYAVEFLGRNVDIVWLIDLFSGGIITNNRVD